MALSKAEGRLRIIFRHCGVLVKRPHSSRFACLAAGASSPAVCFMAFYEDIKVEYADFSYQGDPLQIPFMDRQQVFIRDRY